MKTLRFIVYLFYRYYSQPDSRTLPYFGAISAVTFAVNIHILQLLMIFDKIDVMPFADRNQPKIVRYGEFILIFLFVWVLVSLLARRTDMERIQSQYKESKIKRSANYLAVYYIANILLTVILMWFLAYIRGTL